MLALLLVDAVSLAAEVVDELAGTPFGSKALGGASFGLGPVVGGLLPPPYFSTGVSFEPPNKLVGLNLSRDNPFLCLVRLFWLFALVDCGTEMAEEVVEAGPVDATVSASLEVIDGVGRTVGAGPSVDPTAEASSPEVCREGPAESALLGLGAGEGEEGASFETPLGVVGDGSGSGTGCSVMLMGEGMVLAFGVAAEALSRDGFLGVS